MESCPPLPSFLPRNLQNLWTSSHMGYALVQNGLSLTGAGFSLKMGARRDDLWEAPPGWPRSSWEEDNSAASTGRYPSGHGEQGRAGKESVNIHNLPGKGKCKAKIGPG